MKRTGDAEERVTVDHRRSPPALRRGHPHPRRPRRDSRTRHSGGRCGTPRADCCRPLHDHVGSASWRTNTPLQPRSAWQPADAWPPRRGSTPGGGPFCVLRPIAALSAGSKASRPAQSGGWAATTGGQSSRPMWGRRHPGSGGRGPGRWEAISVGAHRAAIASRRPGGAAVVAVVWLEGILSGADEVRVAPVLRWIAAVSFTHRGS